MATDCLAIFITTITTIIHHCTLLLEDLTNILIFQNYECANSHNLNFQKFVNFVSSFGPRRQRATRI